jgi:uncharacterized protein YggL (DUF469 family)
MKMKKRLRKKKHCGEFTDGDFQDIDDDNRRVLPSGD